MPRGACASRARFVFAAFFSKTCRISHAPGLGLTLNAISAARMRTADAIRDFDASEDVARPGSESEDAERLVDDLEAMGPTFIKLGQLLSTRSDLLPPAYLEALTRLQDDVAPVPFDVVEELVEEEIG